MNRPTLYIACDDLSNDQTGTMRRVNALAATDLPDIGFKVNLDALLLVGIENALRPFIGLDRPLFVDLKMWNGKRTMRDVFTHILRVPRLSVNYITVHALGDGELAHALKSLDQSATRIAATTILTHYTTAYCQRHFLRSRRESVLHFASVALEAGCKALVLPGEYLDDVRSITHEDVHLITPGIREAGTESDGRHDADVTPAFAKAHGANAVVCGSPIMKADDPVAALRRIVGQLTD